MSCPINIFNTQTTDKNPINKTRDMATYILVYNNIDLEISIMVLLLLLLLLLIEANFVFF